MTPLLEIDALTVDAWDGAGYRRRAVDAVSLAVAPGEVLALIGESGAGKSTVALAALGYVRPGMRFTGGRVVFNGRDLLTLDQTRLRDLRGKEVAYVAQSAQAALNPSIVIGEQVAEPLLIHDVARRQSAMRRVGELLDILDLPAGLAERFPHQASGGQLQRVLMAMALACEPRLLILDEPTTALDVTTQIEVLRAIRKTVRDSASAAIYVSHDLAVVAQIADRILVMRHGRMVEHGTTGQIIERPAASYTRTLIGAVRDRRRRQRAPVARPGDSSALLAVSGVAASYRQIGPLGLAVEHRRVLDRIDLTVQRSEVLAVVGESGSGKSTLARVIAGLHPPVEGTVTLSAKPLATRVRQRHFDQRRSIQIVFQSPDMSLNPGERVINAIGRPRQLYFAEGRTAREAAAIGLLEAVGLPADYASRFPRELSGGERQRVAIARAFAAEPEIILCDEILSSLDVVVAAEILDLMRDLRESRRVAYLFISHDLATVATIADRIAVMYAGLVVELGTPDSVFSSPNHPYTSLLVSSIPELRRGWLDEALNQQGAPRQDARRTDESCPFIDRCPLASPEDCGRLPPLREIASGHFVRCHRSVAELSRRTLS